MRKIKRKKHLEMKLQSIPPHPKPKVGLEQYTTPSIIASDLIWNAYSLGDIEERNVLDLGCGSGIFTIGCGLMGANTSCGVDIDEDSIRLACESSQKLKLDNVDFILNDINDLDNVYEVAQGADITANTEAKEFLERMENNQKLLIKNYNYFQN